MGLKCFAIMKLYIQEDIIDRNDLMSWALEKGQRNEERWVVDIAEAIIAWFDRSKKVSISTSGSTGSPKIISHSKESMKISARMTAERFHLQSGMCSHNCLPARYIAGKMMLIRALEIDMDQICVAPRLALSMPHILQEADRIHFSAMTPMQLSATLDKHPDFINKIDQLILGGAPIPRSLMTRIQQLKTRTHATFGMTETITHIATRQVNGLEQQEAFEVLKGVEISAEDDNLIIKAKHLGSDPIKTTDQVELISDRQFTWLGRSDDVINRGGVKIHPAQVEKKLSQAIQQRYIITAEGDGLSGYKPALVIESRRFSHADMKDLHDAIKDLDKLQRPENIYFVAQLIETPTSKVKRDINLYRSEST